MDEVAPDRPERAISSLDLAADSLADLEWHLRTVVSQIGEMERMIKAPISATFRRKLRKDPWAYRRALLIAIQDISSKAETISRLRG